MTRLGAVALVAAVLTVSADVSAALAPRASPVRGEQRVLVVLATWGPQPFAREEVQRVLGETDAFIRASSYGQARLATTVTPWLQIPDPSDTCNFGQIGRGARAAAARIGFDRSAFDEAIYLHPALPCGWQGVTIERDVWLNGALSRKLVAHELGHTFGLDHANTGTCSTYCAALEYGDPYDTMGQGTGDFGAFAKYRLGWLSTVTQPARAGVVAIEPLEATSPRSHALVVTTARFRYWFENRREPARDDQGRVTAPTGLLAYVESNPDQWLEDQISTLSHMLVVDPVGRGTPPLLAGDRFGETGAFDVTALSPANGRARLSFRWTDRTSPRTPVVVARDEGGQLRVEWDEALDTGSGLARYEISVDGGAPARVSYRLGVTAAALPRPASGPHVVRLVSVDRAGNRSAPAVLRLAVGRG